MRAVAATAPAELDQVRLQDLINEYLVALKVAGRSPRTIDWYRDFLLEFVRFVERDGRAATGGDLQAPVVRRWLLALQSRSRQLAPSSLAGRVRTLKAFGTWVASELDLASNPLRTVPLPRVPEQLVPSLRDPEIIALLRAVDGSRDPDRDRAIVLLLLDTGVRVSEAASLRVRDLDLVEGRCRVFGKGSKERLVPVGRRARKSLRIWLSHRRGVRDDDPLFTGPGGHRLTARGLYQLVHRLARRAELQTRCSPHVLRHTFARSFLTNGGDVFSLQRILGHSPSSIQVTRRYVELLDDDLRAVHRLASPADRLGE
ncbi:MAG: tyrosine-type recombinase/integrase [Chloroflexi bacterium]|nr:tyrosine-type recombinase/integrase [Chloroflexota bacterium]